MEKHQNILVALTSAVITAVAYWGAGGCEHRAETAYIPNITYVNTEQNPWKKFSKKIDNLITLVEKVDQKVTPNTTTTLPGTKTPLGLNNPSINQIYDLGLEDLTLEMPTIQLNDVDIASPNTYTTHATPTINTTQTTPTLNASQTNDTTGVTND